MFLVTQYALEERIVTTITEDDNEDDDQAFNIRERDLRRLPIEKELHAQQMAMVFPVLP